MLKAIIMWMIGTAIFALPVYAGARLVKANLNSYGFAFLATFLNLIVQAILSSLIPTPLVGLPLAFATSILIFSLVLGTSLSKAAVIFLVQVLAFAALGLVALLLGGYVDLYGHHYSFTH